MTNSRDRIIEIIAVGSELLTPYYQDTNSLFISEKLDNLGLKVSYKSIVGDDWDDLIQSIQVARDRADMIFTIGGLGPTQDDNTREALAAALGKELIFKEELWQGIKNRFEKRGIPIASVNRKQAFILEGAVVLDNKNGTAPGLWVSSDSKTFILLPGPPTEIKPMLEKTVLPRLITWQQKYCFRRILKITGLTESMIESHISDLYPHDDQNLNLTVLASPGQIEIHLAGYSDKDLRQAQNRVEKLESLIRDRLQENIFSAGEELEEVIGGLLIQNQETLAVAESCTGGLLGHRITNVPGSSQYFIEGAQVYSDDAKIRLLEIPKEILDTHGAVSSETASHMALQIRKISQASYGLAITGIAGPGGGTEKKPVGLVYTSLASNLGVKTEKNLFFGNRKIIKYRSSQKALDMLRRHLQRPKAYKKKEKL